MLRKNVFFVEYEYYNNVNNQNSVYLLCFDQFIRPV